jgi:hypothetical protein
MTQAVLTATLTLIGAGFLFLFSQFISEGIIKPYVEYRKVLAEITYTLIYHANVIASTPAGAKRDEQVEISGKLRSLSAQLRSAITALPFQDLLRLLQLIPPQQRIYDAAGRLIRISIRLLDVEQKKHDEIYRDMNAVGELLQIDVGRD